MANPHFANLGDVWKHLLLTEVISWLQPKHYVETHAGSALYALTDDLERGLGAELFLAASSEIEPLRAAPTGGPSWDSPAAPRRHTQVRRCWQ